MGYILGFLGSLKVRVMSLSVRVSLGTFQYQVGFPLGHVGLESNLDLVGFFLGWVNLR